jgi:acyl carrier protein
MSNVVAMSDQQILDAFARIVAESLRIDPSRVTEDAHLDDLGAESLDLAEITMETEDKLGILISQKSILQTAKEVFGEGVLIQDDRLTEQGKRFFRRRMPDYEGDLDALTVDDLNRLFLKVGTWVRMIGGLMEQRPQACPECGGPFGKVVAGRLKCRECSAECDIPSGEELNRQWVEQYYQQEHAPDRGPAPTPPAV